MSGAVVLIFGDDEYRVSAKTRKLLAQLVPDEVRTTQLDTIDGAVETVDAAVAAIEACLSGLRSMGLFAAERTVWLKQANFLRDSRTGRSERVQEALAPLVELIRGGLPEGVSLVISADGVDKRRALYKALKAAGDIHDFVLPEKSYKHAQIAESRCREYAGKLGLEMSSEALNAFVERVGYDTRQLVVELEKLALYLGDRKRVSRDDIVTICSPTRETAAWDLADAFGRRELPECLSVLRRLLFEQQSPMGLLFGLENRIRVLLTYRESLERRWLVGKSGYRGDSMIAWEHVPDEGERMFSEFMMQDPRKTHPFRTNLLANQAKGFTRRELHHCLSLAIQAHERLVSSREAPESVLEGLLVRALGGGLRAQKAS